MLISKYLLSTNVNTAHPFSVLQIAHKAPTRASLLIVAAHILPWCNNSARIASGIPGTQQLIATGQGWMLYTFIYSFLPDLNGMLKCGFHCHREGKHNPNKLFIFQLIPPKASAATLCCESIHVRHHSVNQEVSSSARWTEHFSSCCYVHRWPATHNQWSIFVLYFNNCIV